MFDNPRIVTLPAPETKIDHFIAKVPALEVKPEVPSEEQIQVNNEVFQHKSTAADDLGSVLGMVSGMMVLHHVAVDTLHDVEDLEGHMLREKRDKEEGDEEEE